VFYAYQSGISCPMWTVTRFGNSKLLKTTIDCNKYEPYVRGNHK